VDNCCQNDRKADDTKIAHVFEKRMFVHALFTVLRDQLNSVLSDHTSSDE
jgi:hypothetical protein